MEKGREEGEKEGIVMEEGGKDKRGRKRDGDRGREGGRERGR